MPKIKINKLNIINLFEYILALFVVLECRSVFQHNVEKAYRFPIVIFSVLLIIIILTIRRITMGTALRILCFSIFLFIYQTIFILKNEMRAAKINYFFSYVVLILLFFVYFSSCSLSNRRSSLLIKISNIIVGIALISLFFWVGGTLLNIIQPSGKVLIEWGRIKSISNYYNLYFEGTASQSYLGIHGNTGVFVESPMYNLHLCIALLVQLFVVEKKNRVKITLLIITIISTASTTGLFVISCIYAYWYIFKVSNNKNMLLFKISIGIIISLFVCILVYDLTKTKMGTSSYNSRLDDFRAGFLLWSQSIFWGVGYGDTSLLEIYKSGVRKNASGFSNSLMVVLSEGGIYFLTFYIMPFILVVKKNLKERDKDSLFFMLVFTGVFIITIFPHTIMMIMFLAYGWSYLVKSNTSNKHKDISAKCYNYTLI